MDNQIKNLFNQEEWIVLTLKNCAFQVNIYLAQLKKLKLEHPTQHKQQHKRFKKIFKYYQKHLIPAIQELASLEQKHLKLIAKNPDPDFTPLLEEFKFHKSLTLKFNHRFEELHKEFYQYSKSFKGSK